MFSKEWMVLTMESRQQPRARIPSSELRSTNQNNEKEKKNKRVNHTKKIEKRKEFLLIHFEIHTQILMNSQLFGNIFRLSNFQTPPSSSFLVFIGYLSRVTAPLLE